MNPDTVRRFDFAWAPAYRAPQLLLGITPSTAYVEVGSSRLRVRFGAWRMLTGLSNIVLAEPSGDFGYLKTVGPPHLSFVDRGVTFATNGRAGVCLRFAAAVKAIEPTGMIRHPGATLTVADVEAFLDHLGSLGVATRPAD